MFYRKDDLDSFFICPKCKERFDRPKIIYPCMKTLCAKCIDELSEGDKFECVFCHVKHVIPEGGFKANEMVESFLNIRADNVHRNRQLIDELKENLNKMQSFYENYSKNLRALDTSLYEHCAAIKSQIDLISDEKIQQINEIREKYLKSVQDYHDSCLKNIQDNKAPIKSKMDEFEQHIDECNRFLSEFTIDDEEVKRLTRETRSKIEQLQLETSKLKLIQFKEKKIFFDPNEEKLDDERLGKIEFEYLNNLNKKIVSGSADKTLKIWDLDSRKSIRTLSQHTSYVNSVVSLDENTIVSCSADKTLKIWNLNDGSCTRTLEGHTDFVYSLAVIDKTTILSGSWDKTIKIWNVNDAKCVKTFDGHTDKVCCVCVIDANKFVSASCDNSLKIWDINEGSCKKTLNGHTNFVHAVSKIDRLRIVSGSYDERLKIWNIETGLCLSTLEGHTSEIYCVLAIDKNTIISGGEEIKIWNIDDNSSNGKCVKTLREHTDCVQCLFLLDKNLLASGSQDNTIKVWNLENGNCIRTLKEHSNTIRCLLFID